MTHRYATHRLVEMRIARAERLQLACKILLKIRSLGCYRLEPCSARTRNVYRYSITRVNFWKNWLEILHARVYHTLAFGSRY